MIKEVRCSGLARPMMCAGYLSFTDLPESQDNEAAKEGTAAGELLAFMVQNPGAPLPTQASNGVYFDDDMRFYLVPIAQEILSKAQGEIRCEQRIDWQTRSGIWIRGSYDISFVHNGILYVDDLKYGWGIVEAKPNWQLLGYGIGEVIRRGIAFDKIVLRIRQPRPHHEDGPTREWHLSYAELLNYKEQIDARMDQIANGFKDLQTGKQCKYCRAAAEACPAMNRLFFRGVEVSTGFVQDQIDDAELSRQLDIATRAQEAIKVKLDSLKELTVSRIKNGKIIPGYITEESYGDRTWKNGITPDVIKVLTGVDVMTQTMLSPAKAEKAGVPKDFIKSIVDRRFLGQKLVKKDATAVGNKIFGSEAPK